MLASYAICCWQSNYFFQRHGQLQDPSIEAFRPPPDAPNAPKSPKGAFPTLHGCRELGVPNPAIHALIAKVPHRNNSCCIL